ncbi:MAG: hypothetical protein CYPHOPRED_002824 [Cyphobasidiales sp. Tagirdzhanova-0007]|nr:MAG: hypothetical protein CYPHOPRED_002824 [Cyphobasidiales sp. Tagirdzhanova-0007]
MSASKEFTIEELQQLKGKKDLHILISGKVYSIADFVDEHPGGDEVLFGEAGQDATEAFEDVGHSEEARAILNKYLVGSCNESLRKGPTTADSSAKRAAGSVAGER